MNVRVFVVEDNPDNCKLITWLLEDEGYSWEVAATAEEALARLEEQPFDLVLMDISLPDMDGAEATRQLRAQPRFAALPIIAITAHAIKGEAERILASGVTALVTKPIDDDQLLATMRSVLPLEVSHGENPCR